MVEEGEFRGLLDRLERAWEALGAPVAKCLRPGLTDGQIDEFMAPTGITLPDELRWWWNWHDGAVSSAPDPDQSREIDPGGWLYLPLREAIESWRHHDGYFHELIAIGDPDVAELLWRPGLFPFTHAVWRPNDVLAADTLVGEHASAPVLMKTFTGIDWDNGVDSVAEVIGIWVELLESGRYRVEDGSLQPVDPMYVEEPRLRWVL